MNQLFPSFFPFSPLCQKTLTVTPVISTKTLPVVLKAATPNMPSSVVAQRPATVAMVAAISHASKPSIVNSQNTPVNLQVASKLTNQCFEPVRLVSKNALVVRVIHFLSLSSFLVQLFQTLVL